MPHILSMEEHLQIMIRKDMILNPELHGKPNMRPVKTHAIYNLDGLKAELQEIHEDATDWAAAELGLLPRARQELAEAIAEWQGFAKRTGKSTESKHAEGRFAEEINRCKAKVEFLCIKSRALNKLIDGEEDRREAARVAKEQETPLHKRCGSFKRDIDGNICRVDGMPVVNGKLPDGQDAQQYLRSIIKAKEARG